MRLPGSPNQMGTHHLFVADGTIANGTLPQLVLAQSVSRSLLILENNNASGNLNFEFGSARGTAVLTSGAVTSVTITNAGFGFTNAPVVRFLGGGTFGNASYLGLNQPNGPTPQNAAQGIAVLGSGGSAGTVVSVTITNPGAGYVKAPYVLFTNSDLDPYGCSTPSATVGLLLAPAGGAVTFNGTCCPTDAVAVFGATNATFVCRWME